MKRIVRHIYQYIPWKKRVFEVLRQFWKPNTKWQRRLTFSGSFLLKGHGVQFRMNHFGYQIESDLFWRGLENGHEKESLKHWIKWCAKSSFILDIGANAGLFALCAAAANPEAKIYAFEPSPDNIKMMVENRDLNGFQFHVVPKGVSNTNGETRIAIPTLGPQYIVSVTENKYPEHVAVRYISIPLIRLETFLQEENLPRVDLIKIDVEGHEVAVLEGLGGLLAKYKPRLLLEVSSAEALKHLKQRLNHLDYGWLPIHEEEAAGIQFPMNFLVEINSG